MKHTTRIAPSPTGMFHLGSARTALFNWLVAKSTGGQFILRIDDTDVDRNVPEAVQVIDDALEWLGLNPDIRFKQSDRLAVYKSKADMLLDNGSAYKDGDAVRLRLPDNLSDSFTDTISGVIPIHDTNKKQIDGMVLIKSDGYPTYHFASVIDDIDYNISWIIRGQDHLTNTTKHIAIAQALGADFNPLWSHIGLLSQKGKKLSKRDGAASLLSYKDEGVHPDAMFNWLLRLGWGPTVDDRTTRTITRDRASELFLNGGKMRSAPANLDRIMLDSLDRRYKAMK